MKLKNRKKDISFFLLVFLIFVLRMFVFSPVSVSGVSMEPTLYSGETGIILKKMTVNRDDIICFIREKESGEIFIKRVIGVAGDFIKIEHNKIFVNGVNLEESYLIDYPIDSNFNLVNSASNSFVIPEGMVFVLGDNRVVSLDSRNIGYVAEKDIVGKLIFSFGLRNN